MRLGKMVIISKYDQEEPERFKWVIQGEKRRQKSLPHPTPERKYSVTQALRLIHNTAFGMNQ
jgi:hypothetical protein